MTARDRGVLIIVVSLALLGRLVHAGRAQSAKKPRSSTRASARRNAQLATAESELSSARGAQAGYTAAYASIVSLGKAVPPARKFLVIYQLDQASNQKQVGISTRSSLWLQRARQLRCLRRLGGAGAATASTAASGVFSRCRSRSCSTGASSTSNISSSSFNRYTQRTASGSLQVSGRLPHRTERQLAPLTSVPARKQPRASCLARSPATAYVLPASQGLTRAPALPVPPALPPRPALHHSAIARVTP